MQVLNKIYNHLSVSFFIIWSRKVVTFFSWRVFRYVEITKQTLHFDLFLNVFKPFAIFKALGETRGGV